MNNVKYGDRVREATSTEGLGPYLLTGVLTSLEQTFVAGIGDGQWCYYCVETETDWEIGRGQITERDGSPGSLDQVSRDFIYASSNGGAAVNWGPGVKTIFNTAVAQSLDAIAGFQINKSEISFNRLLFTATEGQTAFDFVYLPGAVEVRVDGLVLALDQFVAVDGRVVTLLTPCTAGQKVEIVGIGQYTTKTASPRNEPPEGQVFRWGLVTPTSVQDQSGNYNDMIVSNARRCNSKVSDGLLFDGTGEANIPNLTLDHSHAFTICGWYRTPAVLADGTILANQGGADTDGYLRLDLAAAGNLVATIYGDDGTPYQVTAPVQADTEYFVTLRYNGGDFELLLDKVSAGTQTVTPKTPVSPLFTLGHRTDPTASNHGTGQWGGINVYPTVLTNAAVSEVFDESVTPGLADIAAIVIPAGSVATMDDIIAMSIALG